MIVVGLRSMLARIDSTRLVAKNDAARIAVVAGQDVGGAPAGQKAASATPADAETTALRLLQQDSAHERKNDH